MYQSGFLVDLEGNTSWQRERERGSKLVGRRRSEIMVLSEVAVARTANNAQVRLIYRELGFSPQSFPPYPCPYTTAQVSDKQLTFSPPSC